MGKPTDSDLKTTTTTKAEEVLNDSDLFVTQNAGIWQIWLEKQGRFDPKRHWQEIVSGSKLYAHLAVEIYSIAPRLFVLFILSKLWSGVESALSMHLSSNLLRIIEVGVQTGGIDSYSVYMAIVNRLLCTVFVSLLEWWTEIYEPAFKAKVIQHYDIFLMRSKLRLDLSTASEVGSQFTNISAQDTWQAFEAVISFIGQVVTSMSQLTLILHISRSSGGPFFAFLCIVRPLMRVVFRQSIWSKRFIASEENEHHLRMKALSALTGDGFRQEFITGNLGSHILSEYQKAQRKLGDTCTDEYWEQADRENSPWFEVFSSMTSDLPMVYCAINAVINPSKFSIASVAVMQDSSLTLRYSLHSIVYNVRSFQRYLSKMKNLYALSEKKVLLRDGDLCYPGEKASSDGMGFELQNVTFAYPGSQNKSTALKDVSLTIKPGQLVVIVGSNGSGKSTIIKLLTRLYGATSGDIFVDGAPIHQYRASSLHQAMATFTQDHNLYPLSLYENIALGDVQRISDADAVAEAARKGGAAEFIEKLKNGMNTVLDPQNDSYGINMPEHPDHPLVKKLAELKKKIDISGGERQRVVAARTFMQLSSGRVKFVAVDEPSSALDAEAEANLFDQLISERNGKTLVLVTHRFAHLTKRADLIICMKDGSIAESGNHEELISLDGEYSKLYNIQADAFAPAVN